MPPAVPGSASWFKTPRVEFLDSVRAGHEIVKRVRAISVGRRRGNSIGACVQQVDGDADRSGSPGSMRQSPLTSTCTWPEMLAG